MFCGWLPRSHFRWQSTCAGQSTGSGRQQLCFAGRAANVGEHRRSVLSAVCSGGTSRINCRTCRCRRDERNPRTCHWARLRARLLSPPQLSDDVVRCHVRQHINAIFLRDACQIGRGKHRRAAMIRGGNDLQRSSAVSGGCTPLARVAEAMRASSSARNSSTAVHATGFRRA